MRNFALPARGLSLAIALPCLIGLWAVSASAQSVIATIPVTQPAQPAVNPAIEYAYVGDGSSVAVISEKTNAIVTTIDVGATEGVWSIVADYRTGRIFACGGSQVWVINGHTNTLIDTLSVPAAWLAINQKTDTVYASDFNQTVYVINASSDAVTATITVPQALQLDVNAATNRIYIADANPNEGEVTVIDGNTNQVVTNIDISGSNFTSFVAVDPVHNLVYATDANNTGDSNGVVAVISGATNAVATTITIPGEPTQIAVNPSTRLLYIANQTLNEVQIINGATNQLTATTIPVGQEPSWATLDPYHNLLYVTNLESASLSVINTQ
jgi:YVTN family beta-propeller protein